MALLALVVVCVAPSFSSAVFAQVPADRGGLKSATTQATRALASVTPTHYNIDVAFEPEKHFLRATAAVTLRVNVPTDAIEFELNRHLTLRSVTDAQGRSLEFIRSGRLNSHKLVVRLAEPAAAETTLALTFTYDGALPVGPLDYITEDGILLRDESRWYPATDLAAFTKNRITAHIEGQWTGTVPINTRASQVPVASENAGVSSRAIAARKAEGTVSNPDRGGPLVSGVGLFTSLRIDIGRHQHFNALVQSFTNEQTFMANLLGVHGLPVGPPDRTHLSRTLEVLQGFPGQPGAIGYSAPGFLVVSEDVVKWHGYPGFAPSFLPHEIAHQWFPIEVTLASEEDGWLAESLAEYLAWRYLEEEQPDDARRMVELAMRNTLAHEPARPLRLGLKLFALEDWDVTHATLYQRGMLVWRTLETVIDRERVDAALREYYRRHRGGPASIADFRTICEGISGRDLGWFFDTYINGTELPEISLRRLPSAAPNELAGEIIVRNAPQEFQVRVEMRITTASGVIDHSVATRGEVTPFAIDVRDAVTAVALDPRLRILRVTEPARRQHAQRMKSLETNLAESATSDAGELRALVNAYQSAADIDSENLAANHQLYALQIGRLQLRLKEYDAAWKTLDRALALESLDPMATDLHRAWARVFRASIALVRGDKAAARQEAEAGLAMKCPALDTKIAWPDAPEKETTAAEALRAILARL